MSGWPHIPDWQNASPHTRFAFVRYLKYVLFLRDSPFAPDHMHNAIKTARENEESFALVEIPSKGNERYPMYVCVAREWETLVQNCVDLYEGVMREYRTEGVGSGPYWQRDLMINLQNVARESTVPEEGSEFKTIRHNVWEFKEHFERQWQRTQEHLHEEIVRKAQEEVTVED